MSVFCYGIVLKQKDLENMIVDLSKSIRKNMSKSYEKNMTVNNHFNLLYDHVYKEKDEYEDECMEEQYVELLNKYFNFPNDSYKSTDKFKYDKDFKMNFHIYDDDSSVFCGWRSKQLEYDYIEIQAPSSDVKKLIDDFSDKYFNCKKSKLYLHNFDWSEL